MRPPFWRVASVNDERTWRDVIPSKDERTRLRELGEQARAFADRCLEVESPVKSARDQLLNTHGGKFERLADGLECIADLSNAIAGRRNEPDSSEAVQPSESEYEWNSARILSVLNSDWYRNQKYCHEEIFGDWHEVSWGIRVFDRSLEALFRWLIYDQGVEDLVLSFVRYEAYRDFCSENGDTPVDERSAVEPPKQRSTKNHLYELLAVSLRVLKGVDLRKRVKTIPIEQARWKVRNARYGVRYHKLEFDVLMLSRLKPSPGRFDELCRCLASGARMATRSPIDWGLYTRGWFRRAISLLKDNPKALPIDSESDDDFSFSDLEQTMLAKSFGPAVIALRNWAAHNHPGEDDPPFDGFPEYLEFVLTTPRKASQYRPVLEPYEDDDVWWSRYAAENMRELLFYNSAEFDLVEYRSGLFADMLRQCSKPDSAERYFYSMRLSSLSPEDEVHLQDMRRRMSRYEAELRSPVEPRRVHRVQDTPPAEAFALPYELGYAGGNAAGDDVHAGTRSGTYGRFCVSDDWSSIHDTAHNLRYSRVTAAKTVPIIRGLLKAYRDAPGQWVISKADWKGRFMHGGYKAFKQEQIEILRENNRPTKKWRIIPDEDYDRIRAARMPSRNKKTVKGTSK